MQLINPLNQIDLPDLEMTYIPEFIPDEDQHGLYNHLMEKGKWQQDKITVFGKEYDQPRLTALYAEDGLTYSYSGIKMLSHPFDQELQHLKNRLLHEHGHRFNAVLLNRYRSGSDSNGWHSDDEPELGKNPCIASISLGQDRVFQMRHKRFKEARFKFVLESGSLLIMHGATQHHWQHQLPKTKRPIDERINLTFRYLIDPTLS